MVVVDHLGRDELRRPEHHLEALRRVELAREPEVDDLDLIAIGRDAENVLGLQVEMEDVLGVHERDRLADLAHEVDALALRQHVVGVDDALEKFSASKAAINITMVTLLMTMNIMSWKYILYDEEGAQRLYYYMYKLHVTTKWFIYLFNDNNVYSDSKIISSL